MLTFHTSKLAVNDTLEQSQDIIHLGEIPSIGLDIV